MGPEDISSTHEHIKNNRREMDELGRPAHPDVVLDLVMQELMSEAYYDKRREMDQRSAVCVCMCVANQTLNSVVVVTHSIAVLVLLV